MDGDNEPMIGKIRSYYTPSERELHNCSEDCWISIHSQVYDFTKLIEQNPGPLVQPIIEKAGKDISHWFDEDTLEVKCQIDPTSGLLLPHTPEGHFLHVPPPEPVSDWRNDFGVPWWRDQQYFIGRLSSSTRKIQIINTLTQQKTLLEVCKEETLSEILDRYLDYNAHAGSYTWKVLDKGHFRPLDMHKTLEENEVVDDSAKYQRLSISNDFYYPVIHLYFNDDLTVA